MPRIRMPDAWTDRWNVVALICFILAWIGFDPAVETIFRPLYKGLDLRMFVDDEMALWPFTVLMVVRLAISLMLTLGIMWLLGYGWRGFPLSGPRRGPMLAVGFGTGVLVMVGAIAAIALLGRSAPGFSAQPMALAAGHLAGWLFSELVGATGEELLARVALLLVAERFIGRWGAILVSGVLFSVGHWSNPGASWLWLARLFLQGMLLAYAVYRTGSIWWSVGYHTGWNWADAPLFGTAGSGFLRQGHFLDLRPNGPDWITGGTVGPEGSVFAFAAVLAAYLLLRWVPFQAGSPRDGGIPVASYPRGA